jgi:prolyl-tRNA editing enzyme YbaK/EbsC (Cys-tRNA(Pro) deacylase)
MSVSYDRDIFKESEEKQMSATKVQEYLKEAGLGDRYTVHEEIGDTVEHAAAVIGCEPARIAKTMSFMLKSGPILVVSAGDAKANSSKFKAQFGEKPVMIPWDQVEEVTGHEPGAVTALAVNEGVRVFLDVSLKRFSDIHTSGGTLNSTVQLSLKELENCSGYETWVDVCKGWLVNE